MSYSIASLSKNLALEPIPTELSQHCPTGITVTSTVSTATVLNCRRFNLKKANWEGFSLELEHILQELELICQYRTTMISSWKSSEKFLSRLCYTNYIPRLRPTAYQMFSMYKHLYESDPFGSKTIQNCCRKRGY